MNPLLRGGDEIDVMVDEAKRELRTQFMRHYRVIKTWEPAPCPPRPPIANDTPDAVYADVLPRPWFR
jgi:hypothetical protein